MGNQALACDVGTKCNLARIANDASGEEPHQQDAGAAPELAPATGTASSSSSQPPARPAAATPEPKDEKPIWKLPPGGKMSVMMFGMTGSGKSSLGNLLVGYDAFEAGDDTASMTNLESVMQCEVEDNSLTVLDTIGLGDTEISQDKVVTSIRDVALTAPNGIDVLLFVMRNTRITDDAIARLIYVTEFLWGQECLLNLYVVVTFASGYVGKPEKAHAWIERQVEINWRFKHIFSLVGDNPNRFIFIDNPDPHSEEPDWQNRRELSRDVLMKMLCLHPRDVVPPYTHATMERARELMEERMKEVELREQEVQRLEEELKQAPHEELLEASSNAGSDQNLDQLEVDSKEEKSGEQHGKGRRRPSKEGPAQEAKKARRKRRPRPAADVQANLVKAKEERTVAKKALTQVREEVKNDPIFQARAEESAIKATQQYRSKFHRATNGAASACRRLLTSLEFKPSSTKKRASGLMRTHMDEPSAEDTDPASSEVSDATVARSTARQESEETFDRICDELLVRVKRVLKGTPEEVFYRLDVAGGSVPPLAFQDFLRACVPTVTNQQIGALWRRADSNCDGQLCRTEWLALFNR